MDIILIDDEQIALDFFQIQLNKLNHVNVIGAYTNAEEGMQAVLTQEVDVVFLDIHMPGEDGIAVAKTILHEKPHMPIVFVTAFEQYAVHAFEIQALDYLVKPIRLNRLEKTINRVKEQLEATPSEEKQDENLRVQLCKQLNIETTSAEQLTIRWRTARTKELFLLLLQHREEVVHKEQIIEWLWPGVDLEKAHAQLYTTIYHVRKWIEHLSNHFKLETHSHGYILFTRNVEIDVEVWEKAMQELPPLQTQTVSAYEEVMSYYPDSYVKDYGYVWSIAEAERLDRKWIETALNIAKQHEADKRLTDAYQWYMSICTRYPEVEEAHFSVMKHLATEGKSAYVKLQYKTLAKVLDEELGVEPSVYVTDWFNKWNAQLLDDTKQSE